MRHRFLTIEGQDGSGKKTQVDKLLARLNEERPDYVKSIAFPRYDQPAAAMVKKYLAGELGPINSISPFEASAYYAYDRMDATPIISNWLGNGHFVLADRYAASNAAHQGAKIKDASERLRFLQWLNWFEFEALKNVRPALNIILGVPAEVSFEAVKQRAEKEKRQLDEHEKLFDHIKTATAVYQELTELYPEEYKLIDCMENGSPRFAGETGRWLSPEMIHEKIWTLVLSLP